MNEVLTAIRPDPAPHQVARLHGDTYLGNTVPRTVKKYPPVVVGKIADRDEFFDVAEAIMSSAREISRIGNSL